MPVRARLHHRTEYRFDRAVGLSPHLVRLRPALHTAARVHDHRLEVEPAGHALRWQQDPYGNWVGRLDVPGRIDHLVLDVHLEVELAPVDPFDFLLDPAAIHVPFSYPANHLPALTPYLATTATGDAFEAFVARHRPAAGQPVPTVDLLVGTCRAVRDAVAYTNRFEPGVLSPEQTLGRGVGSCRDSAWLLAQVLRRSGVAARFASGYLVQLAGQLELAADAPVGDAAPVAPAADTLDLHAWCEVFLPGAGWVGFDTTSGLATGEGHIPLACTPDPADAAPVSGTTEPCEVTLTTSHDVERVGPAPVS